MLGTAHLHALIALVGLFIVRYGPRPRYVGTAVLLATWGVFMGFRHSALHLARDVGQGFSASIFGIHTYTWAWFIHWTVLVGIGAMLLFLHWNEGEGWPGEPNRAGRFAMGLFVVVVAANALQAFATTGPPPFLGQADPVRFSFDPRRWVWSQEELRGRLSLRGSWTIPKPEAGNVDPDPAHGPLADLPSLSASGWERSGVPLAGTLSGLAHDPATNRFLAVTDRHEVYVLDGSMARSLHHVTVDPGGGRDHHGGRSQRAAPTRCRDSSGPSVWRHAGRSSSRRRRTDASRCWSDRGRRVRERKNEMRPISPVTWRLPPERRPPSTGIPDPGR